VLTEVAVDRGLQIDELAEHAALQSPAGEGGKEALDRIGQENLTTFDYSMLSEFETTIKLQ
jgi:hypothetical protein